MDDLDETRLGIGANNPPKDLKIGDDLVAELHAENGDLTARRDELLIGAQNAPSTIENDEQNAEMGAFLRMISAAVATTKDRFKKVKEPWLAGGRAVDRFFTTGIVGPLELAHASLNKRQTAYQIWKAEEARRKAEEEARQARAREEEARRQAEAAERAKRRAEAEAKKAKDDAAESAAAAERARQAAANAEAARARQAQESVAVSAATKVATSSNADLGRTRGEMATVSLRTTWRFRVDDITLVPVEYLQVNDRLVNAAIGGKNGKRDIPGLTIFPHHEAQNR